MPTPIRQLNTQTHYTADGITLVWPFSFTGGYIAPAHVRAQVRAPAGAVTELVIAPVDLIGPYQLRISPAVPAGHTLIIYRATPRNVPLVDFLDGSQLNEADLDLVAKQSVFISAESADTFGMTSTEDLTALAAVSSANAGAAAASANTAAASRDAAINAAASTAASVSVAAGHVLAAQAAVTEAQAAAASAGAVTNLSGPSISLGSGSPGGMLANASGDVAAGGTLDMPINTATYGGSPGGFAGVLTVTATRLNFPAQSNKTVYAAVVRGSTATFTSLATQAGAGGGSAFTITMASDGVIRFTDTSGSGSSIGVRMAFFGSRSLA